MIPYLNNHEAQCQTQESKLNNQLLGFDEILIKQSNILHPQNTKANLFYRIRPELFALILEFLDIKTCFRFRLVSSRANICAFKLFHQKIKQLHDQQKNLEYELNELQKRYSQEIINPDLLTKQQNAYNGLNKQIIWEIRSMPGPPEVLSKIMAIFCILLDSNIKQYQENWYNCRRVLIDYEKLMNKLLNLKIDNISDSQLKLLQAIHDVNPQKVLQISHGGYAFYQFIQSIVEIRESKYYG